MKATQHVLILDYLEQYGSITPYEAFIHLGITKLATRISELKRLGWEFEQELVRDKNRFGAPVFFMKYRLKGQMTDAPGKPGHWIPVPRVPIESSEFKCSVCGETNGWTKSRYCPNCGAKMEG